jgi:cytoplasmic FMR1 interacting protein
VVAQINMYRQTNRGAKFLSDVENKAHYATILEGLRLLSDWSGKVLRQSAWKYAHPNTNDKLVGPEAVEYERVVKHNYTDEERFVLVEVIACLKGLSAVMLRHDGLLSPIIRSYAHADVQDFVQVHLREMIAFASKKKKAVREELLQLRTMAADWKGGQEPDDPALFGKKVKTPSSKSSNGSDVPDRAVAPSQTQLDLVRTIVYGLVAHRYLDKKLEYSDKDYSSSSIKVMEEFLQRSFFYKYMINYTHTIAQVHPPSSSAFVSPPPRCLLLLLLLLSTRR